MDQIVCNISKIIEETCIAPPIPTLTNLTSKQGGYGLPSPQTPKDREKRIINIGKAISSEKPSKLPPKTLTRESIH
jgi:hypothetical protein